MATTYAQSTVLSQKASSAEPMNGAAPPDGDLLAHQPSVHLRLVCPNREAEDVATSADAEAFPRGPAPEISRPRPANTWVALDRTWAERLGVRRDGGRYRIRSGELICRLAQLRTKTAP